MNKCKCEHEESDHDVHGCNAVYWFFYDAEYVVCPCTQMELSD